MKKSSLLKRFISTFLAGTMVLSPAFSLIKVSAEEYGVDISRYQGNINWDEFAKTDNSFVILRAGTTNYGIDSKFEEYYQGTRKAGVKTGAYLYISALTLEGFRAAAYQFIDLLKGKDWEMPVYIDLEDNEQTALGKEKLTDYALVCMNIISNAGYTTGLYSNLNWLRNYIDKEKVENAGYEIWYAQYPDTLVNPGDYDKSDMGGIWQYSSHGTVQGIAESYVDLNIAYKIYETELDVSRYGEPWLLPYLSRKTMRSGPGNEYGEILNVPQNTLLCITAKRNIDGVLWGRFSYDGYTGWCELDGLIDYSATGVPENPYYFYDVNMDGKVNAADELELMKYILGVENEGLEADLNGDGKVNVFDVQRLKAYLIKANG